MEENHVWSLQLVGPWRLGGPDGTVRVATRQQRLISLLALQGPRPRAVLAGILWPESTERQASGSLRESLWTINHQLPGLLEDSGRAVALAPGVLVDAIEIRRDAAALPGRGATHAVRLLGRLRDSVLLPGSYQDWVLAEQDRWTRLRLRALEGLAERFLDTGQGVLAADAAQCAVDLDPWRESAVGLLLRAHLSSGEHLRAAQLLADFSVRLRDEFGVEPSRGLSSLVAPLPAVWPTETPVHARPRLSPARA